MFNSPRNKPKQSDMRDPHSYTDLKQAHTDHIRLSLYVDFQGNLIDGSALFTLRTPHTAGHLFLDTRRINVRAVHLPKDHADAQADVPFELDDAREDSIKGTLLKLSLPPGATQFVLTFATQPRASSALQWLQPAQTAGKRQPYTYTQCQSIHARSIFPCQDTPSVRIRYTALLNIPSEMTAVMSAGRLKRCPPQSDAECLGASSRWMSTGRVVEHFDMPQPIPTYLFAFAIGDIVSMDAGPRTKIYSEPSPVLEGAAAEFKDVEELIRQGESLFGEYVWDRFDLLVLPPSFPFGGMENPRMVFLTPAVVTGEGSGAQVVAHELAHSWTGNLITNASNNDFWLNEGFTTYAERRIVEAVEGKDKAALNIGLGCASLRDDVGRFKDNLEFTKLRTNQEGIDPDEVYSCVPYEKGFQFLWRIERQVGRAAFDIFLKKYIETFKFQSIDTETFLGFLTKNFPGIEKDIDLDMWVDGTGLPPDIMNPDSPLYTEILSASSEYVSHGVVPTHDQTKTWMGQEWNLFLEHLPRNLSSSQIQTLDQSLRFTTRNNLDVKVAFLTIVAYSGYEPFFEEVEKCLKSVGRLMYLRPIYTGLLQSGSKGKEMAKKVYEDAKDSYHPIAQGVVETLLVKFA